MEKKQTPVYRKWWVIAAACLLVWPLGLVLVALKFAGLNREFAGKKLLPDDVVPFMEEKSTAQIKIYRSHMKRLKSKLNTALATMVIGLLISSGGISYFLLDAASKGFAQSVIPSMGACALFGMAGIMQGTKGYDLLREKKTLAMMAAVINDRRVVTEAELQEKTGLPREKVRGCLQMMFDRCFFAEGVHADEENGTFVCYGK